MRYRPLGLRLSSGGWFLTVGFGRGLQSYDQGDAHQNERKPDENYGDNGLSGRNQGQPDHQRNNSGHADDLSGNTLVARLLPAGTGHLFNSVKASGRSKL